MLLSSLSAECDRRRYKYAEIRPLSALQAASNRFRSGPAYCFHELDLAPSSEHLFSALQKSSIQRKIIRAEKEQLTYEKGHSERLLNEFYRLLLITRKRHGLPPQPRSWFTNLIRYMKGQLQIWVAWKGSSGISAILALRHRSTVVYKYGCSDERFHNLGGMPFLFWKLIEDSKASGADSLDFGRSDFESVIRATGGLLYRHMG
jgi:hypothetical protein